MHLICPPFATLPGITAVPREIENTVYANVLGQTRRILEDLQVTNGAYA